VGSLTDQPRTLSVNLNFLDKKTTYEAITYTDDSSLNTSTKVKISKQMVTSASRLTFDLKSKNGVAIILKKVVL
jgi:alpha-glucosidase